MKGYVQELYRLYQIIKPADEKNIEKSVRRVLIENFFFLGFMCAVAVSFRGATPYLYGVLFMTAVLINRQWVKQRLWKEEKRLLEQLEKYLGDVRHYYHKGGLVEEAIYDSLEGAPCEIALHINQIYDILSEENKEAELRYRELAPNKFLTTFLALCQITMEYGDSVRKEKSLFLTNLNHLREEIRIEILKREKTAYIFSGLVWICLLPVLFLKVIENWGIQNLPELAVYYHGSYGIIVSAAIFSGTWISYQLVGDLRGYGDIYKNHRILREIGEIPWIQKRVKRWIFQFPKKAGELNELLQRCDKGIRLPEYITQSILYMIFAGSFVFIITSHVGLLKGILWYKAIGLGLLGGLLAGLIARRVPKLFLAFWLFFGKREKEDEVLQFHSIILMLMYLKQMNAETILIWLENFSRRFKSSLEECVDNFSYDNEAALMILKEKEPFLPFVRLVEDLEACDQVGVQKAFDEVAGQRSYFLDKRKQDNEIAITEKGALAKVVAYLPLTMTLLFYLIVPFVLESMNQLGGYMSQVGGQ